MHEVNKIIKDFLGGLFVWSFFCFVLFLLRNGSLHWCTGGLACAFHAAAIPAP